MHYRPLVTPAHLLLSGKRTSQIKNSSASLATSHGHFLLSKKVVQWTVTASVGNKQHPQNCSWRFRCHCFRRRNSSRQSLKKQRINGRVFLAVGVCVPMTQLEPRTAVVDTLASPCTALNEVLDSRVCQTKKLCSAVDGHRHSPGTTAKIAANLWENNGKLSHCILMHPVLWT